MAERGEQFSDEILPLRATSAPKVSGLDVRRDTLTVGEPEKPVSSESLLSNSQWVPAWRRNVDLNSPSPLPPSPLSFTGMSIVTRLFRYFFKSRKIEPIGIRPEDVKCDENHVPILYNKQYDIHGIRYLGLPKQPLLFNKPARVFSAIKGKVLNKHKHFTEVDDMATQYDLFNFVCDAVQRHDIEGVLELLKLTMPSKPLTCVWKNFDSTILSPLRVQMMGSAMACKLALDEGWAINIGGGFSHCTTNISGGLAVYDDVVVCLAIASGFPEVSSILVINTDAYQSSNFKLARNINCPVTIIDFFSELICEDFGQANIFCEQTTYIGYQLCPSNAMTNTIGAYMAYFHRMVIKHLEKLNTQPSLCIYIAGTTLLANNPHTSMNFSIQDIVKRDQTVVELMKQYKIPVAILMGGGYQHYDAKASSASIINLWRNKVLEKRHSTMP